MRHGLLTLAPKWALGWISKKAGIFVCVERKKKTELARTITAAQDLRSLFAQWAMALKYGKREISYTSRERRRGRALRCTPQIICLSIFSSATTISNPKPKLTRSKSNLYGRTSARYCWRWR